MLEPLTQFGLLEERMVPSEDPWARPVEYRRTPLFERFMRFEFVPTSTWRDIEMMVPDRSRWQQGTTLACADPAYSFRAERD